MMKNININIQNIVRESDNAMLIAMPHNSSFEGYCFWHAKKLMSEGSHSYAISIAYNDDFIFHLKKYGNGKYNKYKVIDEKSISVEEFEEAFDIMNKNIISPKEDTESYLYVKEPEKIEMNVEILEELKNDNGYKESVNYLESEERKQNV